MLLREGSIHALVPHDDPWVMEVAQWVDLQGGLLLPGFIDIQVNGGGGVLFNNARDVDGLATIARAHRRYGTTGLLPTLISDTVEVMAEAIAATRAAIAQGVPGILGIHLEGPYLNPLRKGIHDHTQFRVPQLHELMRCTALITG